MTVFSLVALAEILDIARATAVGCSVATDLVLSPTLRGDGHEHRSGTVRAVCRSRSVRFPDGTSAGRAVSQSVGRCGG